MRPLLFGRLLLLLAFCGTSYGRLGWLRSLGGVRHRTVHALQSWRTNKLLKPSWRVRGGGGDDAKEESSDLVIDDDWEDLNGENDEPAQTQPEEATTISTTEPIKKVRRTSEMVWDLRRRSGVGENEESIEVRQLIANRAREYISDLNGAVEKNENKLPHPKKLLHYLAPKVPAIRQAPDVNLRIHSARSDIDSGLAACIIATVAYACEIYDKEVMKRASPSDGKPPSAAPEITTDRRFEQLVECVLTGLNVKKRKREALSRHLKGKTEDGANIEELLDEENVEEDEGLKIRDSCKYRCRITQVCS